MNRRKLLGVAVFVLLVAVALRTQSNERRTMEQERGFVGVTDRTHHGHTEYYTRWIPLTGYGAEAAELVQWLAFVFTDPSKPEFALVFNNSNPNKTWESQAKQPAAIWVDGQRHELKPYQAVVT